MQNISRWIAVATVSAISAVCSVSAAQDRAGANADGEATSDGSMKATLGAGEPGQDLPSPRSDDDPNPTPPSPEVAVQGVTEQAGIGGTQAYGRAGVLELGGAFNLTLAKDFTQIGFTPSIGWFLVDNFELSFMLGLNHAKQTVTVGTTETDIKSTVATALLEPSFHLPFSERLYGFVGLGFGLAYQGQSPGKGAGTGFAVAPRLGLNILVGRSGVLTPALTGLYQTTDAVSTPTGTVVAVSSSFGMQAGYTVMW